MKSKRLWLVLATALVAAFAWWLAHRRHARAAHPEVAIQDGAIVDFSSGRPVVKDSPADKAIVAAAVKEMDEAAKSITFAPLAAPKADATKTKPPAEPAQKK